MKSYCDSLGGNTKLNEILFKLNFMGGGRTNVHWGESGKIDLKVGKISHKETLSYKGDGDQRQNGQKAKI